MQIWGNLLPRMVSILGEDQLDHLLGIWTWQMDDSLIQNSHHARH